MKTKQPTPAEVEPLYYRLYVLYFEGEQAVLKTINSGAFFRISIWNKEVELATMIEGLNPVMLANKMFLGSTSINFSHAPPPHRLQARLGSHVNSCDYVMGSAELDLENINNNFTERGERFSGQESIPFALKEGELRLVFNIFVETGKVELDSSIREFKRFEK